MMRSMFSAVTGLRSFQTMMDVVGNNISNVNTSGYKSSQVTFEEALQQMMRGPGQALNPMQVGLGVKVASIDSIFTQGATQVTGRVTDVAIQGDGFLILENDGQRVYTRNGALGLDAIGNLVGPDGYNVLGWAADSAGLLDENQEVAPVQIPVGQVLPPQSTNNIELGGNLSADAAVGEDVDTSIVVYDSLGNGHNLVLKFMKSAPGTWDLTATLDGTQYTLTPAQVTFGADGHLTSSPTITFSGYNPPGADPLTFDVNLDGIAPLVQFGGNSTAEATSQDGRASGVLKGFGISNDGSITGQFSNGETRLLARIALAAFANPAGLVRVGNSNFSQSINSGEPLVGAPGTASRGSVAAGALEMSNVELAAEFTNLIIAQRGFQANSRVISASDEMLTDLVNLKR